MKYEKGKSGNPGGRPKGSPNKASGQLRETITDFLEQNFEKVSKDFASMSPRDRVKFYCDLMPFAVARLQSVSVKPDFEDMTDEQLDRVIEGLQKLAK